MNHQVVVETFRTIVVEVEHPSDGGPPDGAVVELEVTMPGIQGPAGPAGADGAPGPPGPSGAAQEQLYSFASPSTVWNATHTIPITPSVYAYDTNDVLVEGDVSYPTPTTVRVEWAWPMAGRLVLTT